jgi:NADPH:quinone reductase-like Zn-dependent oxidoreductase
VGERVVLPFLVRTWRERLVLPARDPLLLPPDGELQQVFMLTINPGTAALFLSDFVDLAWDAPSSASLT